MRSTHIFVNVDQLDVTCAEYAPYIKSRRRSNAIKLSQGEHAGSPLQSHNTRGLVGADLLPLT
ncbi:MAG: hypothetical protein KAI83_08495 [Thiomargarita sp.]|nr:hypothetical protein [Thiomargarita sp.]